MIAIHVYDALNGSMSLLRRAWRRHRAWVELAQLDGDQLKDIGLGAGDTWAAAEAFGEDRPYMCSGRFVEPTIKTA